MQLLRRVPWICQPIYKGSNVHLNKLYHSQIRTSLDNGKLQAPLAPIQLFSGHNVVLSTNQLGNQFSGHIKAHREIGGNRLYCDVKGSADVLYKPIYKFSRIVLFRLICRAKLYQTGLVFAAIPLVNYLHNTGTLSTTMVYSFAGVVSLAAIMLYVMGEFFRKVVGIISVNPSLSTVQISHLTFWGKRRDILVDTKDIIPISDTPQTLGDVFVTIKFYNSDKSFYLFHNYGKFDAEKMKQVLK